MPNFCPNCGIKIIDQPQACPDCNHPFALDSSRLEERLSRLETRIPRLRSYEYKSKWGIFGWPLVHVCMGADPETGKRRVARGMIAYGDMAIGAFAGGGLAVGGIAFGGVAFGIISLGGASLGLLTAIGGLAVSMGLATGGCAVGFIALGGSAIGYYCLGGGAFGQVAYGGNNRDLSALAFFQGWRGQAEFVYLVLRPTIVFLMIAPLLLLPFLRRLKTGDEAEAYSGKVTMAKHGVPRGSALGLLILILFGGVTGVCLIWLVIAALQIFVF